MPYGMVRQVGGHSAPPDGLWALAFLGMALIKISAMPGSVGHAALILAQCRSQRSHDHHCCS
jgi:hypothetical protein